MTAAAAARPSRSLFLVGAICVGAACAAGSATWPDSRGEVTDCDTTDELLEPVVARFLVVADVEGVAYREDIGAGSASCRDGSMIISNSWGWRRQRLRIREVVSGSILPGRLVAYSSEGEFGPHDSDANPRLVCLVEAGGRMWARDWWVALEVADGGFAVEASDLDAEPLSRLQPRPIRVRKRGRFQKIEAVLTSEIAPVAGCG